MTLTFLMGNEYGLTLIPARTFPANKNQVDEYQNDGGENELPKQVRRRSEYVGNNQKEGTIGCQRNGQPFDHVPRHR